MNNIGKLIVHTPYRNLFQDTSEIRRGDYVVPDFNKIDSFDTDELTRSIALTLQKIDSAKGVLYGIEITSAGKGRNIRIPMVRISNQGQTVWKVITDLKKLEKTVETLKDTIFFLRENNSSGYPLPTKVVVVREPSESLKANYDFIKRIVDDNNLILFTLDFLRNTVKDNKSSNFDEVLNKTGVIFAL